MLSYSMWDKLTCYNLQNYIINRYRRSNANSYSQLRIYIVVSVIETRDKNNIIHLYYS